MNRQDIEDYRKMRDILSKKVYKLKEYKKSPKKLEEDISHYTKLVESMSKSLKKYGIA